MHLQTLSLRWLHVNVSVAMGSCCNGFDVHPIFAYTYSWLDYSHLSIIHALTAHTPALTSAACLS